MKNKHPIRAASRELKRRERLNRGYWCCFRCTAMLLEGFIPVSLDWLEKRGIPSGLLEAHHVVGKAHDAELTVPLCRNCHALATEDLLRAGVSMKPTADRRTLAEIRLEASATFLERFALSLRDWIKELPEGGDAARG
jgi:hypothetical protein